MTTQDIEREAKRAAKKFEVAKKIRTLLDSAREEYGADDWDGEDLDAEVQRLVFDE